MRPARVNEDWHPKALPSLRHQPRKAGLGKNSKFKRKTRLSKKKKK